MDREYITEHQLVERYLQGKLSTEEQADFEEGYLSSQQLLDELEATELLQQGLGDLATLHQGHEAEARRSWAGTLFHSPHYAMAASFLLLVSLGVSSTLIFQLGAEREAGYAATSAQIVPLVSVRSAPAAQPVNTLQIGAPNQQSVLMLDPGLEDYAHYRATIYRQRMGAEPEQVWQVDGLRPGYEDMLALALSSRILEPGDYQVELEGWRSDWTSDHAFDHVDSVPFRVVIARRNP